MAKEYEIKAVLTAKDQMTGTVKGALGKLGGLNKMIGTGLGFGFLMSVGSSCFNAISSSVGDLVSEINEGQKVWKTFEGNMKMLGKNSGEIDSLRKGFQKYAQQTIYSSADMASTYSQLAAVGVQSADKLVTGFAGLAASASDPTQAMKTLSQQATQMAGKPKVAWQDFKLMLEQTPAGLSQVAKEMGISMQELVQKVQAGEVATSDFFEAVNKVGNSNAFQSMATQYQTLDQAMDGLKETLANTLTPTFEMFSKNGIKAVEWLITKIESIDGEALAEKISGWMKQAQPYFDLLKQSATALVPVVMAVGKAIGAMFQFMLDHAEGIVKVIQFFSIFGMLTDGAAKAQAFGQAVGSAMRTVVDGVTSAINFLSNLPTIIKTQFQASILEAKRWANDVVHSASEAMSNFLDAVSAGIASLPSLLYRLLQTAVGKVKSWGSQLASAAAAAVKKMVSSAVSAAAGIGAKFVKIGGDIVQGVIKGIGNSIGNLYSYIQSKMSGLVGKAASALGIGSPSKEFASGVGRWIPAGVAEGIKRNEGVAIDAVRRMCSAVSAVPASQFALAGGMSLGMDYSYGSTGTYTIEIPVEIDGRQVAKATASYTADELDKISVRNARKAGKA